MSLRKPLYSSYTNDFNKRWDRAQRAHRRMGYVMKAFAVLVAGAMSVSLIGCGSGIEYSDGARVGVVQKMSKSGIFTKTWSGELVMEGVRVKGDKGGVTNVWEFGAVSDAVAQEVEKAAQDGVRVRLTYSQHIFTGVGYGNGYLVTKVERL